MWSSAEPFLSTIAEHLDKKITQTTLLRGGDTSQIWLLTDSSRRRWVLKALCHPFAALIVRREVQGLGLLGASQVIRTPRVVYSNKIDEERAFLLLEFIEAGPKTAAFWEHFGRAMAALHGQTAAAFGFAHDNFIGTLPQSNQRTQTWASFYAAERLQKQMEMARQRGLFDRDTEQQLARLCQRLQEICPEEPPALIHGDFWSGNFLCNAHSKPVLIDPAPAYAHREMDLAMSLLFGGFDARFYAAYEEVWPLAPGFTQRADVYQLYYLLVHVNLFGRAYEQAVRQTLKRWS